MRGYQTLISVRERGTLPSRDKSSIKLHEDLKQSVAFAISRPRGVPAARVRGRPTRSARTGAAGTAGPSVPHQGVRSPWKIILKPACLGLNFGSILTIRQMLEFFQTMIKITLLLKNVFKRKIPVFLYDH